MDIQAIPRYLKERKQWVVWQYEQRGEGKPTKIPYQANKHLKKASTTNEETWSTYSDAVEALADHHFDGLGFVFAEDDGVVGIDLDNCFEDNVLTDEAEVWVDKANSYTELSPSGNGLHILVLADYEGKGQNTSIGEIYNEGRFFTMTGDVFDGLADLVHNQSVVNEFSRAAMASKEPTHSLSAVTDIRSKVEKDVFTQPVVRDFCQDAECYDLFLHKTGLKSQSEYDLAIVSKAIWEEFDDQEALTLIYWNRVLHNNDPSKVERPDYQFHTLSRAHSSIDIQPELDAGDQILFDQSEVKARVKEVSWLIDGYLPQYGLVWLTAEWSSYKTFLALDMAWAIAQGRDWCGIPTTQGNVVYVAGEGFHGLSKRMQGLSDAYGPAEAFRTTEKPFMMTSPKRVERLVKGVQDEMGDISLLIVDTKSANMEGSDSDAKTVNELVNNLRDLELKLGCTILVIDHVGHGAKDRIRGASQQQGAADLAYLVEKDLADPMMIKMGVEKPPKDFEAPDAKWFKMRVVDVGDDESTLLVEEIKDHALSVTAETDDWFPTGYAKQALDCLIQLQDMAVTNAQAHPNVQANIDWRTWCDAMKDLEMPRNKRSDCRNRLLSEGYVVKYGSDRQFIRTTEKGTFS